MARDTRKQIIVTGSSGFIGRNLAEQLRPHYRIFAPSSKELNLLDEDQVRRYFSRKSIDTVLHCATHNGTIVSNKDLSLVFKNNLRMFMNLARCNSLYKRMFYFGSGAEYDMRNYIPKMREEYFDTHVPVDDYGFSKYIMARSIECTKNIYDLRLFGVYGKYEDWRIRFISQSICRAIFNKQIVINQNVFFDYMFVADLVKIIHILIEKKTISHKYFNVCTGAKIDLVTLAKMIVQKSNKKLMIKINAKGLKKEYSGNNTRLLDVIGNFEFIKSKQAISDLYEWYLAHRTNVDKSLI